MANEPRGAWARPRPAASRTPQQSRSSNASPAPASTPSTAPPTAGKPAPAPAAPAANVWAQRAAAQKPSPAATPKAAKKEQSGSGVAAATPVAQEKHVSVNNFNESEVRQMLGQKEAGSVYKVDMSASASDPASMANGKNFWAHLEEQVTAARQKDGGNQ